MADVTIDPGRAGITTAMIRLWHEDFSPYDAERVRLALDAKVPGTPGLERDAVMAADGTWVVDNLRIQSGGVWTARVIVERNGSTLVLDAPIVLAQCSNEC
jgi:hypothetical protein